MSNLQEPRQNIAILTAAASSSWDSLYVIHKQTFFMSNVIITHMRHKTWFRSGRQLTSQSATYTMLSLRAVFTTLFIFGMTTIYANEDGSSSLRGAVPDLIGAEQLSSNVGEGAVCVGCCTYYGVGRDNCPNTQYCSLPVRSCNKKNQAIGVCQTKHVACVFEDDPQCGCDGNTYASKCMAQGSGVNIAYRGKCRN